MTKLPKKMLILALNEFNCRLLESCAKEWNLRHLSHALNLSQCNTTTEDTYESNFLEPWTQWVSVQTGCPSRVHRVKHLGDIAGAQQKQIWEILSEHGISSGVWGAMNATRRNAEGCRFFFPDPWTFTEEAFPKELNDLLKLPRYVAKNYLNLPLSALLPLIFRFLKSGFHLGLAWEITKILPELAFHLLRFRGERFVYIAYLDHVCARLFLSLRKKHKTQLSFLFMNSLAHMQHHHWESFSYAGNHRLRLGLKIIDRTLGEILASLEEGEAFAMLNALSQVNSTTDDPWILYRPVDQKMLLNQLGIRPSRIESLMSHDAHLFFVTEEERKSAESVLQSATLEGKSLFLVESYPADPRKLFFRLDFTDPLPENAMLMAGSIHVPFFRFFRAVIRRTGKHIPSGTIYHRGISLPASIYNHEFASYVLATFDISLAGS